MADVELAEEPTGFLQAGTWGADIKCLWDAVVASKCRVRPLVLGKNLNFDTKFEGVCNRAAVL